MRGTGLLVGVLLGAAVVLAASAPLSLSDPQLVVRAGALSFKPASTQNFAWPSEGSASVAIPTLGIRADSATQPTVPIASLTKLMTAYVVMEHLPLQPGETGPCLTVTPADVTEYQNDQRSDQSSVKVVAGTTLCEIDLLNGLFVHSANNYATLLIRMMGTTQADFVALMNQTAVALGMSHTTYMDPTGIDSATVSTTSDQMRVVEAVMAFPVITQIVRQTSVVLPGAGEVHTFTPLLGTKGVVGIKSGRTDAAGGCDAMALEDTRAGKPFIVYAVVLGQRGTNLLVAAGDAAYALAHSAADQVVVGSLHTGQVLGSMGWEGSVSHVVASGNQWFLWWRSAPALQVRWTARGSNFHAGQRVAVISAPACVNCTQYGSVTVTVTRDITRPPWWNGLR